MDDAISDKGDGSGHGIKGRQVDKVERISKKKAIAKINCFKDLENIRNNESSDDAEEIDYEHIDVKYMMSTNLQETPISRFRKRIKRGNTSLYSNEFTETTNSLSNIQTVVPVNQLPLMYQELVKNIPPNSLGEYDLHQIQTVILNSSTDLKRFKDREDIMNHMRQLMINGDSLKLVHTKPLFPEENDRFPKPTYDEEGDKRIVEKYHGYMNNEENVKLRVWRTDDKEISLSDENLAKFQTLTLKYPNGPHSNKKIAKDMGLHPNHVVKIKRILKRKQREAALK